GDVLLQRAIVVNPHLVPDVGIGLPADRNFLLLAHQRELAFAGRRISGATSFQQPAASYQPRPTSHHPPARTQNPRTVEPFEPLNHEPFHFATLHFALFLLCRKPEQQRLRLAFPERNPLAEP